MVTIMIVTDAGQVYAMSKSIENAVTCLDKLHNDKGKINVTYISDHSKRVAYLSKAFEQIEGGGN